MVARPQTPAAAAPQHPSVEATGSSHRRAARFGPRREHLAVVFALCAIGSLICVAPSPPNDLWWHLRLGQIVAETGAVPTTQLFSWSLPADAPFLYGAWLGELLLYWLYRLGGVEMLHFARNILGAALLAIVVVEARRRNGSWQYVGAAVCFAGMLVLNNVSVRPQMFAWVPFGLFLLILGRYATEGLRPIWLAVLPLLMVFWVNVHGSFVLGAAILLCDVLGSASSWALNPADRFDWRRTGWIVAATVATLLAMLANPRGPEVFAYVAEQLNNPAARSLTTDWQPPTPTSAPNVAFFGSILALFVVFGRLATPPRPTDVLLVVAFVWLAWSGQRNVFWYSIAAMPVLVEGIMRLRPIPPSGAPEPIDAAAAHPVLSRHRNTRRALPGLLLASLAAVIVLVQPWFVQGLPLPGAFGHRMLPRPAPALLTTETPIAAAEYLRERPGPPLFAEVGFASYLIWAIPDQQVFIDPRFELYPSALWGDYVNISLGRGATELLDKHGAGRVLLSRNVQPELAGALAGSPRWALEYEDAAAQLWRGR